MLKTWKVAYWKLDIPWTITDSHWGRQAIEGVSAELDCDDVAAALFDTREAALEAAGLLLVRWDELWGWQDSHRRGEGDARTTSRAFDRLGDEVRLTRCGEIRSVKVVTVVKRVVVDGEEFERRVEVREPGEWKLIPELEEVIKIAVFRMEVPIISSIAPAGGAETF